MIDKQAILERIDLLTLIGGDLKRKASTNGGEYTGPCPFCGGSDRFNVQPYRRPFGLWMCRNCTGGKWQNAIDFVIKRDNLDFKTACAALAGGDLPTTRERRPTPPAPAYNPPADNWQAQALRAVEICQANLWGGSGAAALDWLLGRGLSGETIQRYKLGYSPGANFGNLYIRRGVLIPAIVAGEVWYLKISLMPGDSVKCGKCEKPTKARQPCPFCGGKENKYRSVTGSRTAAIFGADDLEGASMALFCEGEIDAMTAYQDLGGVLPTVTLGSADNHPDLATWGAYLVNRETILALYDDDQAGDSGAAWLQGISDRVKLLHLPEGVKDINDYYTAGGDLGTWLTGELDRLGLLEADRV